MVLAPAVPFCSLPHLRGAGSASLLVACAPFSPSPQDTAFPTCLMPLPLFFLLPSGQHPLLPPELCWDHFPPTLVPLLLLASFPVSPSLLVSHQKPQHRPSCLLPCTPMSWFLCFPSPKASFELPNLPTSQMGQDPLICNHFLSFLSLSRPQRPCTSS